ADLGRGAPVAAARGSCHDLGADWWALLQLVYVVTRRYGTEIDLSRLSHRVSLTEILGHIDAAARRTDAPGAPVDVEVWQRGEGRDVLCLVHPVGGDIHAYRPLVSALDDRLTVCLIADPALSDPHRPAHSIAERAAQYLEALRGEFPDHEGRLSLAGWSFGAWMALSMAALEEENGRLVHGLYLLDPPPPGAGARLAAYDDGQVDAVFTRELSGNRTGGLSARGRDYAERLSHCCRANLAAMGEHRLPRLTHTPTTLWLAERVVQDAPSLAPEPAAAERWHAHLPVPVRTHRVDADHYALVAPPHIRSVAEVIEADLADPAPTARRYGIGDAPGRPAPIPSPR
ncbi:thioesterase domain-containing protein, partial [Streptomyces inhibens]|uniref:thioesterase domain-containing protein n=1 Tax=Streptomyces inhibens TaxID=2293571 RepID=UPI0036C13CF1